MRYGCFPSAVLASLLLVASTTACEPSPELKQVCQEYVRQQERTGKTDDPDAARERCLRLNPEQVRCLMKASGRNARIACTQ